MMPNATSAGAAALWVLLGIGILSGCESRPQDDRPLAPPGARYDGDYLVFSVVGIGLAPVDGPEGNALAEEAARVDAQAKLLKKIKGAHVTSESTVGDYQSRTATEYVSGWLRGVEWGTPKFTRDGCRMPAELRLHHTALSQLPRFVR